MQTIETHATIKKDRKLTVNIPPDIKLGKHKIIVIIDDNRSLEQKFYKNKLLDVTVWKEDDIEVFKNVNKDINKWDMSKF